MAKLSDDDRREIWGAFQARVNMSAKEQEHWLSQPESSVGRPVQDQSKSAKHEGETDEKRDARHLIEIRRKLRDELDDADYEYLRRVSKAIDGALTARPPGDIRESDWRYSLMNYGHDPLKEEEREQPAPGP